jgi:hypothetical protein
MLESLKRRRLRIQDGVPTQGGVQPSLEKITSYLDTSTADEYDQGGDGYETEENVENQALSLVRPTNAAQLQKELGYIDRVMLLGDQVRELQQETKFLKLRELIESSDFRNEQLLIFTEHRDTLDYLRQRFEALGYTGQLAYIHGGMDVEERERQRIFFMPPEIRREQGIKNPDAPTARFMLATDAAGEGINLQFVWVMVNFDIPWKQKKGRPRKDEEEVEDDADGTAESKGNEYRLLTWQERASAEGLGESKAGNAAPLIDKLHRLMYLFQRNRAVEVQQQFEAWGLANERAFKPLLQAVTHIAIDRMGARFVWPLSSATRNPSFHPPGKCSRLNPGARKLKHHVFLLLAGIKFSQPSECDERLAQRMDETFSLVAELNEEIARLTRVKEILQGQDTHLPTNARVVRKRVLSAEARARISAAQKRRWAAQKKATK